MKKVIILNKKEGETPFEALENFRVKNPAYRDTKLTYAGRLDPMASGLLLVLAGEEVKKKEIYLAFDKEYEFEVLFGFATDTYDILGKVFIRARQDLTQRVLPKLIKENLKYFTGEFTQEYPRYSSKTVAGKPLFAYARAGEDVMSPARKVKVKKLELLKIRRISAEKLLENIERRIKKVKGDFRQNEILKIWRKNLSAKKQVFKVGKFKIKCGSGTYVRSIAYSLGERLGIPTLAFSIRRTRVGRYVL